MTDTTSPSATGAAKVEQADIAQAVHVRHEAVPIYPEPPSGKTWTHVLMKAVLEDEKVGRRSKQSTVLGVRPHPFDFREAARFLTSNPHHAAAIMAKAHSTTGLGFVTDSDRAAREAKRAMRAGEMPPGAAPAPAAAGAKPLAKAKQTNRSKVATTLDPLCSISFQDLMSHIGEDLANTHNGFMEVVRRGEGNKITGLHHIRAHECRINVENLQHDYYFEINTPGTAGTRKFCRFGDKERFMRGAGKDRKPEDVSEVIFFRYPSSLNRWYGVPTWLSAVASIELVQALHQHEFDFYNNRGVPEFMLFIMGRKLSPPEWKEVEAVFRSGVGLGNQRKSSAFNFGAEGITVQVEKLALEGKSDGRFSEMSVELALEIVAGHQIPPLLAGITIPGKLGAANELPNALMAYQTLAIAPAQGTIQTILGNTLGNPTMNGSLGLEYDDFEMRTILDVMEIGQMDTIARMRQSVPEANAQGRNPADGLKKSRDSSELVDALLETRDPSELIGGVLAAFVRAAAARAA